ncbi:MAG: rhomboid family intramembrane serine protease [Verrucomicrobiota bacterium]
MSSSWPPNPRDAKHRQPVRTWHAVPVTMVMIAICLFTALRTQMGEHGEAADWMYFRSQTQRQELEAKYQSLATEQRALEDSGIGENDPKARELEKRIIAFNEETLSISSDALADIKSGQVWRLFTPMFLHFSILHLVFNVYWLWMLGALLEIRYRSWNYLLLVLAVALVSNLAQALARGTSFGGMSGVNYGLFGFLFLHGKYHPAPSFRLDSQTVFMMLAWLVFCFTGALGPVANWAHSFGFLTGASAGFTHAMLAGGGKLIKRRSEFKRAVSSVRSDALHQCHVCGTTERDDPDAEFRVCPDGEEYCTKHLPNGESP